MIFKHNTIAPAFGRLLAAAAVAASLWACRSSDPGRADGPPARIVTLTPSSTELVAAVGAAGRIVGVDRYSTYPPEVKDLPVVGDFLSPNIEAIVRLRPDLVVMDEVQARIAPALARGGVTTLVLPMHTLKDVEAGLRQVGEAVGESARGQEAARQLAAAVAEVRARGKLRRRRPRVLAVVDREPGGLRGLVAAGPDAYLDELLAVVGADNALADSAVRYPKISADQILRDPPDVILDASQGDPGDWQKLAGVPAVASGRVHSLRQRRFRSPSPQVGQALLELERILAAAEPAPTAAEPAPTKPAGTAPPG